MSGSITQFSTLTPVSSLQDSDEVLVFQVVSGTKTGRRGSLTQLRGQLVKAGTNITIGGDGTISSQAPFWWTNTGAPSGSVGVNYDYSIDPTNGDLYQKYSGTWTLVGNLRGPAGPTGPANNASPTQIGTTGNYLTITAGAAAGNAIAFTQAGSGGYSFAGNATVSGSLTGNTLTASTSSSLAAATATSLTMSSLTGTGFGTAIGNVLPPLINWNSSGLPGIKTSSRMILGRNTPTSSDYADFQFIRSTTFTGGTLSNINAAVRVQTTMGSGDATNTWNLTAEMIMKATAGLGVGAYLYAKRDATNTGGAGGNIIIGAVAQAWDATGQNSALSGNAVALEIDVQVVKADDLTNLRTWGGTGSRKGIHIGTVRADDANTDTVVASSGIWFANSMFAGGADSNAYWGQLIGVATNTRAYSGLDMRGALAPPGSSNPVIAVNMEAGMVVDFKGGTALTSAPQRYIQYTTSGTARLRYMAGALEALSIDDAGLVTLGGNLKMGSNTASGFGTVIGQIPLFVNFEGSGLSGLLVDRRLMMKQAAITANDYAVLHLKRDSTSLTNTDNTKLNQGLRVEQRVGPNDKSLNWGIVSTIYNSLSTGGGNSAAMIGYAWRPHTATGNGGFLFGSVFGSFDQSGNPSSTSGITVVGQEIDISANGLDDAANANMYGVKGARVGLNIVGAIEDTYGNNQTEFSHAIWVGQGTANNLTSGATSPYVNWNSILGLSNNTQAYQIVDSRGGIVPTGYSGPLAAVRMLAGHAIDFNGGPALNSAAGNYLQYTTSGTARLRYMIGATEGMFIDNSGNGSFYGSLIANSSTAAPITLANGVISVPSSQNLVLRVNSAGSTISAGASSAGLGNAITITANSNGNALFGAAPNDFLVANRATVTSLRTPGSTYALSGSVTPTAFSGNGTTATVTFAAISGVVIPVGSSVTVSGATPAGYNGTWTVTASTTTTVSFACTATGALTVAGSMAYAMATPELILLQSNWSGTPAATKQFAPHKISIPTDTADTRATSAGAAALLVTHNFGGAARGGRLGLGVIVTQTSAVNDPPDGINPNQQHTAIDAHLASQYNAGGTGTLTNAAGSMYGLNPQVKLQAGATYWRLLNGLGEVNISLAASSRVITLGGTVTVGDTLSVIFASAGIAGSPVTISWVVGTGQTLTTIANNLEARINQNAALQAAQVCAIARGGVLTVYWYTHLATLTITTSTSVGATETMTMGSVVSGASVDIKAGGTIVRLADDTGPASLNSAALLVGAQSGATTIGAFGYGVVFGGVSGYDSIWPFGPNSTLIGANPTINLGGTGKSGVIIATEALFGVDFQTVSFGSTGAAWRSPGFSIGYDGSHAIGGAKIAASSAGLSIDTVGATASAVALASGGGGGSGSLINNYFEGDIGFVAGGVLKVTGVNSSTGAITSLSILVPPSHQGSAPTNPVSVTGGSGVGWTVNITWPSSPALSLQASGGATTIGGDVAVNTNKFNVTAASGNTAVAGTLAVTGAATLSSTLGVIGDLAVNTNKFTVVGASGNTAVAGTLAVTGVTSLTGDVAVNTNKFNVTAASGNTAVAGTLAVTGAATLSSTLGVTGNVAVNTNKFNVTAASGNTAVAGTLTVTGATTLAAATATTPAATDSSTSVATTAYVQAQVVGMANWGTAVDGNVTISSGTTTLTRDMHYNTLTINGTGVLDTAGYTVFVRTLDISAAAAGAIIRQTRSGTNATSATGAAANGGNNGGQTTGGAMIGSAGGTGNTTTGSNAGAVQALTAGWGGDGAAGGTGGSSTSAGGAGASGPTVAWARFQFNQPTARPMITIGNSGAMYGLNGGSGGGGGGQGGGDGTNAGGGGGSGGNGGGAISILARTIARGTNTTAGIIRAKGGNGGNGANGVGGNAGGGGGGGGAGGGFVWIVCETLTGSTITNAIDVGGGTGGTGGNGVGTGNGGDGGTGGKGGCVHILVLGGTPSYTSSTQNSAGSAGTAHTGGTGGAGGAGATVQANL